MDDRLFLKVETEGAMGGENNGYMQILLGGGYRLPLWNSSALKLHVAAGPAGGGTANTGGGLLLDGGIGFEQNLTDRTALEISLGGVTTPTRKFEAVSLGLKLNYQFGLPNASAEPASWNNLLSAYNTADLRVRLTNQTYFKGDPQWRNQFIDQPVSNLGVQLDYFVTPNWFLTGQALAAYEGKAGAYMVGEVGTGLQWPVTKRLFVEGEVLVGAAGGGGLAVSGGLVGQANASVGYHLTDTLSLLATLGRIEALSGNFKANVAGASLTYQFTGFTRK